MTKAAIPGGLVALLALVALAAVPAMSAERALKGAEIEKLLAGNTVFGKSGSDEWRQFFDAGGSTTYVTASKPPSQGLWRIDGDKFCSQWPPSGGWACYDVTGAPEADPPTITWIGESGTKYPGEVRAGDKL